MMSRLKYCSLIGIVLFFLVSLLGCASSNNVNSGFLGDTAMYAKLALSEKNLDKTWVDPDADLNKYHKVMLDQVVFYFKEDAETKVIDPDEIKELTDAFNEAFIKEIKPNYPIVAEAGPDVLRVKIAIVDIEPSNRALDSITSVMPMGIAINLIKTGAGGAGTGVGSAAMEVMLIDSQSNTVIALGKDIEVGSKLDVAAKVDEWGHAKSAFAYWAKSLKEALDNMAAGTF